MRVLALIILCLTVLSSCTNKKSQTTADYQLQDTSTVVVKMDTSKFYLSNFTISVEGDSLQLAFTNNKAFDLFISKTKDSIHAEVQQNWAVTDSSFIMPTFKTLHEDISFNKKHYKKGDTLESKITLNIVGYHKWPSTYTDTMAVNGWVKAIVN